jgi:phosphoribosyl-AMP cyclohydrolase
MRVRTVRLGCDRDSVLLLVEAAGPACHTGATTCFFEPVEMPPARTPSG